MLPSLGETERSPSLEASKALTQLYSRFIVSRESIVKGYREWFLRVLPGVLFFTIYVNHLL